MCGSCATRRSSPLIETFDAEHAGVLRHGLRLGARPRAREGRAKSSTISGYLGSSSDEFDEAMGDFAMAYADQAERDHAALKAAVRKGKIEVYREA